MQTSISNPNKKLQIPGVQIGEEIGRGADSIVYRATHNGQTFAIKVHHEHRAEAALRMRREAAFIARLHHPALAAIMEEGQTDGRSWMIMEYVEGQTLAQFLRTNPLQESSIIEIAKSIAGALGEVHRFGMVHRDVKPQNIIFQTPENAKLIDFGFAKRFEASSAETSEELVGTLLYSSPEQTGMLKRPVDGRADLYSLGIVLFECIVGVPPFQSTNVGELLQQHAAILPPNVRELNYLSSPAFSEIIAKLLAKDPDDRYQTAQGLISDLEDIDTLNQFYASKQSPVLGKKDEQSEDFYDIPLVGRDKELKQLKKLWKKTLRRKGGVLLVQGKPGTGKSRLVRELLDTARSSKALILSGKCSSTDPVPFAPIRQGLESYLRKIRKLPSAERKQAEEDIREAAGEYTPLIRRFSPRLVEILGKEQSPIDIDAHDTFHGVLAEFFLRLSETQTAAILFIDDVQWIDDSSQQVLRRMQIRLKETPLLIATTARDDADSLGGLKRFTSEMEQAIDETLVVTPLKNADIVCLIKAHLGGGALEKEFLRQLTIRTEGNPFAIGEYIRALLDAGLLRPNWGHWRVDTEKLDQLQLSNDAIQLVVKRIDALDEYVKQILSVAAILGSRFVLTPMSAIFGEDSGLLHAAIGNALQERFIERTEEGEYIFVHDRVQEAFISCLSEKQQSTLHQMVAEVLDTGEQEDPEQIMALARHYALGLVRKNPKRVYEINLEAGLEALEAFASDRAYDFLQEAQNAAKIANIQPDLVFYQTLGEVCARTSRGKEAREYLQIAIDQTTDPLRRASIRTQLISVYINQYDIKKAWEEGMRAFRDMNFPWYNSKLLQFIYTLGYWFLGIFIRWTGIGYGTAKGKARERYSTIARSLIPIGMSAYYQVNTLVSVYLALRGLYIANRLGLSREMVSLYSLYGAPMAILKKRKVAFFYHNSAIKLAEQMGDRGLLAYATAYKSYSLYFLGNAIEADTFFASTIEKFSRWLQGNEIQKCMVGYGANLQNRGYWKDSYDWTERSLGIMGINHNIVSMVGPLAMMGKAKEALEALQVGEEYVKRNHLENITYIQGVLCAQKCLYYLAQEEFGSASEQLFEDFDSMSLSPGRIPLQIRLFFIYGAHLRLAQCFEASEQILPQKIEQLKKMLGYLSHSKEDPFRCNHLLVSGGLAWLEGNTNQALLQLQKAEALSLQSTADSPWTYFEVCRLRARILIAKGNASGANRLLSNAANLAAQHNWIVFARQLQREFGVVASSSQSTSNAFVSRRSSSSVAPSSVGPIFSESTSSSSTLNGSSYLSVPNSVTPSPASKYTMTSRSSIHLQRQLDALLQVSLASASILDPDQQARVVLDEIVRIVGAERAYLFLTQPDGKLLLKAGRDAQENSIEELIGYSSSILEQVLKTKKPVVFSGTEDGELVVSESVLAHNLRSIMAVPLLKQGKLFGLIYLDNRLAKGLFTDSDVEILLGLANHIAVALETVEVAKLEKERAQLERDLAITATVQSLLLPKQNTMSFDGLSLSGFYRSAEQSGGDWWWYEQKANGNILLLLGDVTGHGVGPAMVAATVASSYFTLRRMRSENPALLLRNLNMNFQDLCEGSYMMTLSAVEIDPIQGHLKWWSAGAPPLLLDRQEGSTEALSAKGVPLGGGFFELGTHITQLKTGDRLLLFSDGLLEARTKQNRPFGIRRLRDTLRNTRGQPTKHASKQIIQTLESEQESDHVQEDDITFILLDKN